MRSRYCLPPASSLFLTLASLFVVSNLLPHGVTAAAAPFQAGAAIVDVSPTRFPVTVNAMFTERSANKVVDPLEARALALDDGSTRIVLCVVDTCMMPRHLIDQAKSIASEQTGVPAHRMLISATHTHSAPAAMGCLGSRVDPQYAAFLPARIALSIATAVSNLVPAQVGWGTTNDWQHTFNRRWIRRADRILNDPFGNPTVRANMHPGHESPDAIGPSGPVDPGLSVLAVKTVDGKPLAVLANYSQHYYGSPLLSSDYFGRFTRHLAAQLGATNTASPFVAIMSQGTSGDLMWMDYSAPRHEIGYDAYAQEIAQRVTHVYHTIQFRPTAELQMAERTLELGYRIPSAERLAWARKIAANLGDRLPQTHPEIYALEAIYLHERPRTELKLQAIRVGELGITALPNEVYAITGLKLKEQSPLTPTFNIELANGAEGYIPPPEQHGLGGYTTWPARTAGLEVQAEPKIVDALLALLEQVAAKPRRPVRSPDGPYAKVVLAKRPRAFWRLNEIAGSVANDATGNQVHATLSPGVALYLPGVDHRAGFQPPAPEAPNPFSDNEINRAPHLAGGFIQTTFSQSKTNPTRPRLFNNEERDWSIDFWFWNGLPTDARGVTGWLAALSSNSETNAPFEGLYVDGTGGQAGRLVFTRSNQLWIRGNQAVPWRSWQHILLARRGRIITLYLNGKTELTGEAEPLDRLADPVLYLGTDPAKTATLEGKIDEVALFDRALTAQDAIDLHNAATAPPPPAQSKPTTQIQPESAPLSPELALKKIQLRDGFDIEIAAAEPHVVDPVAIDWDAAGRLWVVEMADYPLGLDGHGKPGGRVRVLEDRNHDGRYDHSTLFAQDLPFPTGIAAWRDGVLVTAAPEILFLKDTDGDGKADVRRPLFRGFLEGNQQLRVNGLRWGLDNWIYCASGAHYAGYGSTTRILSTLTGREIPLGSRDFRFHPDTGEFDPQSGPSQYGRERDDWGNWFGVQNSFPLWHYVLADHYLRRNPHLPPVDVRQQVITPRNPRVFPASRQEKRYHSFNEAGHFTSACSPMIYRDNLLLGSDVNLHSFTCEPFHNLVHHAVVRPAGVSFSAARDPQEQNREFFASEDRWCRPVMVRTGPDGALWVVDMYRYMIEHPEWLPPAGRSELMPHYRAGDDLGRIYRIYPRGRRPAPPPRLDQLSTSELAAKLESSNGWIRDRAQQMLLWRGESSVVPHLERSVRSSQSPQARLHALCTLDGLKSLKSEIIRLALADPHPGVQLNAIRLAEGKSELLPNVVKLVDHPDPKVRLQLACSLGEWTNEVAGRALGQLAISQSTDPLITIAIFSSAMPHLDLLVESAMGAGDTVLARLRDPLITLALGLGQRTLLARLLSTLDSLSTVDQVKEFGKFLTLLESRNSDLRKLQANHQDALAQWLQKSDQLFHTAHQLALSPHTPASDRVAAAVVSARNPEFQSAASQVLLTSLTPQTPIEAQRQALSTLGRIGAEQIVGALLARWESFTPELRNAAANLLLTRDKWTQLLVDALQKQEINSQLIDPSTRSRLLGHRITGVKAAAQKVFQSEAATRPQVVDRFRPALQLQGRKAHGAELFQRLCATCHRFDNQGREVGPDLRAVSSNSPEKLLIAILDPNAVVEPGYAAYTCELKDGTELFGVIGGESATEITLKLADGTFRTVVREQIHRLQTSHVSLMPEGLEQGLTAQDLADLIAFIREPSAP